MDQGIRHPSTPGRCDPSSRSCGLTRWDWDGGFKETTAKAKLQQERILHADDGAAPKSDDSDDSDEELKRERRKAREAAGLGAGGGGAGGSKKQYWKKHERRELQVKTAAELRQQWAKSAAIPTHASQDAAGEGGGGGVTKIVDMQAPRRGCMRASQAR